MRLLLWHKKSLNLRPNVAKKGNFKYKHWRIMINQTKNKHAKASTSIQQK